MVLKLVRYLLPLIRWKQATCAPTKEVVECRQVASGSFLLYAFRGQILLSLLLDFLLRCDTVACQPVVKICLWKETELAHWLVIRNRMTHHQLVKIADLQTKIGCCLCCGQEWVLNFLHITKFAFNFLFCTIPDCGFQTAEFEWFSTANFAIFSGGCKLTLCVFLRQNKNVILLIISNITLL